MFKVIFGVKCEHGLQSVLITENSEELNEGNIQLWQKRTDLLELNGPRILIQ